jgi:hypothetical protein
MSEGRTTFPTRVSSAGAVRYGLEALPVSILLRSAAGENGYDKRHGLPLAADAFGARCWASIGEKAGVRTASGLGISRVRWTVQLDPLATEAKVGAGSSDRLQQPRHTWARAATAASEEEEGSERDLRPPRSLRRPSSSLSHKREVSELVSQRTGRCAEATEARAGRARGKLNICSRTDVRSCGVNFSGRRKRALALAVAFPMVPNQPPAWAPNGPPAGKPGGRTRVRFGERH